MIEASKIQYDHKGNLVDVRFQKDIEAYAAWQVGNRQLNRELLEFQRMKAYYGENAPYKTLGGFRRARRAQSHEFKQYKQVWTGKDLTISESDVIITSENIKRALGEKTFTLQNAIRKADENVAQAFKKYQSQLRIIDAHYKRDEKHNYHFDHNKGGIFFDIDEDSLPSDGSRKQFGTYFHETGHNLDYAIGQKLGVGYASGGYKCSMYNCTFNQMIVEEGRDFIEQYRNLLFKRTGKSTVTNEEVYREIYLDFKDEKLADRRQLSDILDGITDGKMRENFYDLGSSHTARYKDYWKYHPVGGEAFAHFTSILGSNQKKKEMYMAMFPKSFQIYMEIIRK